MAYQYAAFFSYKRDPESDGWHQRVKDLIESRLRVKGIPDAKIFFDTEDITSGARWREKLATGLTQSRCIICIWSPAYFQSRWCTSELRTFEKREELSNRELIVPARYHDGESFPPNAKDRQAKDFSEFAYNLPVFWQTSRAIDFEPKLWDFAEDLAKKIAQAPAFSDAFPLIEVPDRDLLPEQNIGRIADN